MKTAPVRRRVALLLCDGYLKDRDIAETIGITERTVKAHLQRMYRALNIVDGIKKVKLAVLLTQQPMLLEGMGTMLLQPSNIRKNQLNYRKRRKDETS
jgi:DNA-binding NarL/FixJ family response regulator